MKVKYSPILPCWKKYGVQNTQMTPALWRNMSTINVPILNRIPTILKWSSTNAE